MNSKPNNSELALVQSRLRTLESAEARRAGRMRVALRALGGLTVLAALALPAMATALGDAPNSFVDGGVISAAEMNENFAHVVDGVTLLQEQTEYTTGALCGISPPSNGNIGGYAAAKDVCVTTCANDPAAHVCTAVELVRHASEGGAPPSSEGRYATGTYAALSGSGTTNDCSGFTVSTTLLGATWGGTANAAGVRFCSQPLPLLCCAP